MVRTSWQIVQSLPGSVVNSGENDDRGRDKCIRRCVELGKDAAKYECREWAWMSRTASAVANDCQNLNISYQIDSHLSHQSPSLSNLDQTALG